MCNNSLACIISLINVYNIELDNPGEVSQILSGITFDRNNIFWCGKKLLIVLKITCMLLLSASKNIVPIKSYATFKSSKFATLPQDYPTPSLTFGDVANLF